MKPMTLFEFTKMVKGARDALEHSDKQTRREIEHVASLERRLESVMYADMAVLERAVAGSKIGG